MADDASVSMQSDILTLTAEITAAYLGNSPHVKAEEIPSIITSIRSALAESSAAPESDVALRLPVPSPRCMGPASKSRSRPTR